MHAYITLAFNMLLEMEPLGANLRKSVLDGLNHTDVRAMKNTLARIKANLLGTAMAVVTSVAAWMSSNVITCSLDTKMSKALNMMASRRIRHLVVVDGNRPLTVISSKELLTSVHENDELEIRVLQDLARVAHGSAA